MIFIGRKCGTDTVGRQVNSAASLNTRLPGNARNSDKPDDSSSFDDHILLPDINEEGDNSDSHRQSSFEPEREGEGPEGGPRSTAGATQSLVESSQLLVAGPYDYGALKASLLMGRLPDDDKYKVLKHLDQPLQFKFPPVMEGR